MNPRNAGDIRAYMDHVFAYKRFRLRIAKWSLVMALAVMMVGLAITAYPSKDQAAIDDHCKTVKAPAS
jgi:hypothetical protein